MRTSDAAGVIRAEMVQHARRLLASHDMAPLSRAAAQAGYLHCRRQLEKSRDLPPGFPPGLPGSSESWHDALRMLLTE